LTVLPVFSSFTLVVPCGLWHDEHSILPSRTGMWPDLSSFATLSRWQVMQVPCWFIAFSCEVVDIGLWMLWQLMHETLRASCWLPFHRACSPLLWQVVQVALTSFAEILLNCFGLIFSGSLACASPGPWHVSASLRGCRRARMFDQPVPRRVYRRVVSGVAGRAHFVPTYPACGVEAPVAQAATVVGGVAGFVVCGVAGFGAVCAACG
jgi:hypothetical protein